ncbi:MAG: transcription antitermination factor NusB [Eubacteriales bacterium]|nr:transcription antitermination factor NusB [Eubacteriales bacterium]
MTNLRYITLNALYKIIVEKKLSHEIIKETFNTLENTEKAYAQKVIKGVLEHIEEIDNIIQKYSKYKINKLKPIVLLILRQSIFEMFYMDSIPTYATINEAIKLVKKYKLYGLAPFVNALLRKINDDIIILKNEDSFKSNQEKNTKHIYFRINDIKNSEYIINELLKENIDILYYDGALNFNIYKVLESNNIKKIINSKLFKDGFITIQDASSIFMVEKIFKFLCSENLINKEIKILDICAAPGGKSIALKNILDYKNIKYKFILRDKNIKKIELIRENLFREKIKEDNNFSLEVKNALDTKSENSKFDLIICDAPCSGLGVIAKKPDIIMHNKEKIQEISLLQKQIIDNNINKINNNGLFIYSTCTITKEENDDNVEYILNKFKNIKLLYKKQINVKDENKCDGFFISIFKNENKKQEFK